MFYTIMNTDFILQLDRLQDRNELDGSEGHLIVFTLGVYCDVLKFDILAQKYISCYIHYCSISKLLQVCGLMCC